MDEGGSDIMIHFFRIPVGKAKEFSDIIFGATLGVIISDISQYLKEQRQKRKIKKEVKDFLDSQIKDHKDSL